MEQEHQENAIKMAEEPEHKHVAITMEKTRWSSIQQSALTYVYLHKKYHIQYKQINK